MTEEMDGQMNLFDPDSWSGKTSPEHSAATKARTSEPSSKRRQGLRTVVPLFLDLRKENGLLREPSWEMGGPLLGEYSTPSFGESPRDAVESHLSQILEENAPPPILFERESVSGNTEESGKEREGTAGDTETGSSQAISFQERAGCDGGVKESLSSTTGQEHSQPSTINECYPINTVCLNDQGGSQMGVTNDVSGTLRAQEHGHQPCIVFEPGVASRCGGHVYENGVSGTLRSEAGDNKQAVVYGISSYESNAMKSSNPHSGIYEAETARTLDNNGGSPACNQGGMAVIAIDRAAYNQGQNAQYDFSVDGSGKSQTMVSKGPNAVCIGNGQADQLKVSEKVGALNCMHDQQAIMAYSLQGSMIGRAEKNGPQGDGVNKDRSFTLNSTDRHAVTDAAIVRRLTPLEAERLQGYPDGWTDIGDWTDSKGKTRKCTDSARYKALGNSIALPPWTYVLRRLNAYCKEHTMASLFDGIGGFPLIWTRLGGACLWASEIEEFPIAVTERRFK